MPTVLLARPLLNHPRDGYLDDFLEVAFAMSEQLAQPVIVQEIEGQLSCFVTPPVWLELVSADYVTLVPPALAA